MTPRDPKARLTNAELRLLQTNGSPAMQSAAAELLAVRAWADRMHDATAQRAGELLKRSVAVELAFKRAKAPT